MRRCFDCVHIQPRRSGEHFDTVCDKTGNHADPAATCEDFEREGAVKRKSPPAAKQRAIGGNGKYSIKSRMVRKVLCGVPNSSLTPRNEREETMVSEGLERIGEILNDYARKTARKAVSRIGRD